VRADLARYIRDRKLAHPIAVGHSLGGFLALWLAASEPDLVGAVVAVDGVPYLAALTDRSASPASMEAQARAIRRQLAASTVEQWAAQTRAALAGMITSPAEVERIAATSSRSSPGAVADAVYEMLTTDLRPEMGKVRAPVLLLAAGTADVSSYEAQVAPIRDHRVVPFPGARHFIMLDAPDRFLAEVEAFLAGGVGR
jgi:pimeloyl-ACP methyl ester carboxylesterase